MRGGIQDSHANKRDHIKLLLYNPESQIDAAKKRRQIYLQRQQYAQELQKQIQLKQETPDNKTLPNRRRSSQTQRRSQNHRNTDRQRPQNQQQDSTRSTRQQPPLGQYEDGDIRLDQQQEELYNGQKQQDDNHRQYNPEYYQDQAYNPQPPPHAPIVNHAEMRKQQLADAMEGAGDGLKIGFGGYGGGSGPLRDANGNIIADLNAIKRYPSGGDYNANASNNSSATYYGARAADQQPVALNDNNNKHRPFMKIPMVQLPDPQQLQKEERQRQQIAFRAALEEQMQEKKRLKDLEKQRQREEDAEEEARLQRERERLQQQFRSDRAPPAAAVAAEQGSKAEKMERDGVLIKFKPPLPSNSKAKSTNRKSEQQQEPAQRVAMRRPSAADSASVNKRRPKEEAEDDKYLLNASTTLVQQPHSLEEEEDHHSIPKRPSYGTTITTTHEAQVHSEINALKTALKDQLVEIKQLKDDAYESERRSMQVVRDMVLNMRSTWLPITGSGGQPQFIQQQVLPCSTTVTKTALPGSLSGSLDSFSKSIPIIVTSDVLRLEDSRPSTSLQQQASLYVPVLHTVASRLRNTTYEEIDATPKNQQHVSIQSPRSSSSGSPRIAAIRPSNTTGGGRKKSSLGPQQQKQRHSSSSINSKNNSPLTAFGRAVPVAKDDSPKAVNKSGTGLWRGGRKLWPFSQKEKKTGDGLWAWDEEPIKKKKSN